MKNSAEDTRRPIAEEQQGDGGERILVQNALENGNPTNNEAVMRRCRTATLAALAPRAHIPFGRLTPSSSFRRLS